MYLGLRNAPPLFVDPYGLKCRVAFLVGHGYSGSPSSVPPSTAVPVPWAFQQAAIWFDRFDECDRIAPFTCGAVLVPEFLSSTFSTSGSSPDDTIDLLMKIGTVVSPGFNWIDEIEGDSPAAIANMAAKWNSATAAMMDDLRDNVCKGNCCCTDIMLTFHCQEGDPEIDGAIEAILTFGFWDTFGVETLPDGETFCGKTWRYNCKAPYWTYEGALTEDDIEAWIP